MANDQLQVTFPAEIRQVSSKKTASLDLVYRLVVETSDPSVLNLGVINDTLVDVTVKVQD